MFSEETIANIENDLQNEIVDLYNDLENEFMAEYLNYNHIEVMEAIGCRAYSHLEDAIRELYFDEIRQRAAAQLRDRALHSFNRILNEEL